MFGRYLLFFILVLNLGCRDQIPCTIAEFFTGGKACPENSVSEPVVVDPPKVDEPKIAELPKEETVSIAQDVSTTCNDTLAPTTIFMREHKDVALQAIRKCESETECNNMYRYYARNIPGSMNWIPGSQHYKDRFDIATAAVDRFDAESDNLIPFRFVTDLHLEKEQEDSLIEYIVTPQFWNDQEELENRARSYQEGKDFPVRRVHEAVVHIYVQRNMYKSALAYEHKNGTPQDVAAMERIFERYLRDNACYSITWDGVGARQTHFDFSAPCEMEPVVR